MEIICNQIGRAIIVKYSVIYNKFYYDCLISLRKSFFKMKIITIKIVIFEKLFVTRKV